MNRRIDILVIALSLVSWGSGLFLMHLGARSSGFKMTTHAFEKDGKYVVRYRNASPTEGPFFPITEEQYFVRKNYEGIGKSVAFAGTLLFFVFAVVRMFQQSQRPSNTGQRPK
jgi:hypothetical protein